MHWSLWAFCILVPIAVSMALYGSIQLSRKKKKGEGEKEEEEKEGKSQSQKEEEKVKNKAPYSVLGSETIPPYFFITVWTFLYILQGFALALTTAQWSKPGSNKGLIAASITAFIILLILNCAYLFVQFKQEEQVQGLNTIYAMTGTVALCICLFALVNPLSGALLLPTGGFLALAAYLQRNSIKQ